jgi:hypothetical protein
MVTTVAFCAGTFKTLVERLFGVTPHQLFRAAVMKRTHTIPSLAFSWLLLVTSKLNEGGRFVVKCSCQVFYYCLYGICETCLKI